MRILVVTPFPPHPHGRHGGAVYLGTYIEALAQQADVALACLASPAEAAAPEDLPPGLRRVELVPHAPVRDLAGPRRWRHWSRMAFAWGPGQWPLLAAKHRSAALTQTLESMTRQFDPEVVLLEMAVMAQYAGLFGDRPTVLTDHERGDPMPVAIAPLGIGARRDRRLWQRYVGDHYSKASLVQTLNVDDATHLGALLDRPVEVRPPVVPIPDRTVDPAKAPPRVLFLGNFLHAPNTEACLRLVDEVWPLVRRGHPEAEIWLVGAHMPGAVQALRTRDGVRTYGAVEDLFALFGEVRMLLAPLYSGGGTRIKVLTAMAHGLPVVSNRLGLRGIEAPANAAACHEAPADLASAVSAWLEHEERAGAAGAAARSWIQTAASPASVVTEQLARFQRLLER